jgi:hypothetical protein
MEFTSNSCSSKRPKTPIYRLGVRMDVRQNLLGSRPDGEPWPSGGTTVRQDFPKFSRRNLSYIRTSSGRDGSIIRTDARPLQVISHNRFRASGPWSRSVRKGKLHNAISIFDARESGPRGGDVQTVEVESAVTIYDAPAFGPQLADVRTVHFELRFLPYGDMHPDGIPHCPDS